MAIRKEVAERSLGGQLPQSPQEDWSWEKGNAIAFPDMEGSNNDLDNLEKNKEETDFNPKGLNAIFAYRIKSLYNSEDSRIHDEDCAVLEDLVYKFDDLVIDDMRLSLRLRQLFEEVGVLPERLDEVVRRAGLAVEWGRGEELTSAADLAPAQNDAQGAGTEALSIQSVELWTERGIRRDGETEEEAAARRKENPAAFIRRVFESELRAGTLTRVALKAQPSLYQSYATWISRHPQDDLGLPTAAGVKVKTAEEFQERRRAQLRAADRRYRQRLKQAAFPSTPGLN